MYKWEPVWSTEVKIESGGKFPLGLNRFHDGLETILIKSIVNTANRLRYISYYNWIIGDIEKNVNCNNYNDFVEAFQHRENALVIGFYLLDHDSIIGILKLRNIINKKVKKYNCAFKLMDSSQLGGFGLYYKGTMQNLGLIEIDENGISILTDIGQELYKLTDNYIKNSDYYKKYKGKITVPNDVLKQWGEINDLNNIKDAKHIDERDFYKNIIFHLDKKATNDYRRDSFSTFLEAIIECSRKKTEFDEDILRNMYFYSCYYNKKEEIINYKFPEYLIDVCKYWMIYEGHVYFRYWILTYFKVFMEYLKSFNSGATVNDFIKQINKKEFNKTLKDLTNKKNDFYNSNLLKIMNLFKKKDSIDLNYSLEELDWDEEHDSISEISAKLTIVLCGLYMKFKEIRKDSIYNFIQAKLFNDLWFNNLYYDFPDFEQLKPIKFINLILKRYILNQHDNIMLEKQDLRKAWYTTENNVYFHQSDVNTSWRGAKFNTIMNFLQDMNIITYTNNIFNLSKEGQNLYKKLKNEYYK